MNEKTGKIGEHNGTSYYLLYTPNGQEDRQLDLPWLEALQKTDKNRNVVVYCRKILTSIGTIWRSTNRR